MATACLNTYTVQQPRAAFSRLHMLFHFTAMSALLYYRVSNLMQGNVPFLSWGLITISELIFAFIWTLTQAFRWRPVIRTVAPENLPLDEKLPGLDVFICTADPKKEHVVDVMNTVLSAMALDYPAEKLAVYLSDDGGTAVTLHAMKEASVFARSWIPFCRMYGIKTRSPEAFFSSFGDSERELLESPVSSCFFPTVSLKALIRYLHIPMSGSNGVLVNDILASSSCPARPRTSTLLAQFPL